MALCFVLVALPVATGCGPLVHTMLSLATGWHADMLVCRLAGWMARWSDSFLAGRLAVWMVVCLAGGMDARLADMGSTDGDW